MAEYSGFFNAELVGENTYDRVYLAESFAKYFSKFIGNGVFINPSTQLQVTQNDVPDRVVKVSVGGGYINGYWYENDSTLLKPISLAGGNTNRIDAVVLRWSSITREIKVEIKEGESSGDQPTPPIATRNDNTYELILAYIDVPKGKLTVTNADITDTRSNLSLCGFVKGVVDQIDTTNLFNQFQASFSSFMNVNEADFEAWFSDITSKLGTEPATSLQLQIDEINAELSNVNTELGNINTELEDIDANTVNGFTVESNVPANAKFTDTVYTHPTNSGNKHIPAGGSSGQVLKWSADGTASWGTDNDTIYTHPTNSGNKHIPSGGSSGKVLKWVSDGTASWQNDNDTVYTHPSTHPPTILSSGTLPAGVLATNSTDYTTSRIRNARFGTTAPSSLANGEIFFVYE